MQIQHKVQQLLFGVCHINENWMQIVFIRCIYKLAVAFWLTIFFQFIFHWWKSCSCLYWAKEVNHLETKWKCYIAAGTAVHYALQKTASRKQFMCQVPLPPINMKDLAYNERSSHYTFFISSSFRLGPCVTPRHRSTTYHHLAHSQGYTPTSPRILTQP